MMNCEDLMKMVEKQGIQMRNKNYLLGHYVNAFFTRIQCRLLSFNALKKAPQRLLFVTVHRQSVAE